MEQDNRTSLSVTRRLHDVIYVGDEIEVKVQQINKDTVRIRITAPRDVAILRDDARVKQSKKEPLVS